MLTCARICLTYSSQHVLIVSTHLVTLQTRDPTEESHAATYGILTCAWTMFEDSNHRKHVILTVNIEVI